MDMPGYAQGIQDPPGNPRAAHDELGFAAQLSVVRIAKSAFPADARHRLRDRGKMRPRGFPLALGVSEAKHALLPHPLVFQGENGPDFLTWTVLLARRPVRIHEIRAEQTPGRLPLIAPAERQLIAAVAQANGHVLDQLGLGGLGDAHFGQHLRQAGDAADPLRAHMLRVSGFAASGVGRERTDQRKNAGDPLFGQQTERGAGKRRGSYEGQIEPETDRVGNEKTAKQVYTAQRAAPAPVKEPADDP